MPASSVPHSPHPYEPLTPDEVETAAMVTRAHFGDKPLRFNTITLTEPPLDRSIARMASVLVHDLSTKRTHDLSIRLGDGVVESEKMLAVNEQAALTPDDCLLAEEIAKRDERVARYARRHGIEDVEKGLVCDPWSVHLTEGWEGIDGNKGMRLVQLFLYAKKGEGDNHYACPLAGVVVVDLFEEKIVAFDGEERIVEGTGGWVNYRGDLLGKNSYLERFVRKDVPKPLKVVQPEGTSFRVVGREVEWQKWKFRVGFTTREGLVLRDLCYDGREVMRRAAVVEMAVPYGEGRGPYHRKCAFDVGDYGLGFCANSLKVGCDCLGSVYYFDEVLNDSEGKAVVLEKGVCLHEEDAGILYKHVEYRDGHVEVRRARRLVVSFVATVVNYEYLFYWYLHQDGSIMLEIKLSGELSTNVLSEGEVSPRHGVLVAPGVNAQVHQHMFCVRLDVAVDGPDNSVEEVEFVRTKVGPENIHGNGFHVESRSLRTEKEAKRDYVPGRTWRVSNTAKKNKISGKSVGYKLVPYAIGAAQSVLLTREDSLVNKRGRFATKGLWVTPYEETERFPAGEYPVQSQGGEGLEAWTNENRGVENQRLVLWHSFGVAHLPRTEDFPVMPCESTGFALKPDCFFLGNPGIDLPPDSAEANGSACCS
eukprot:GFKZ01015166.1.p1 GENE.GFKZ01015166.1~~GFKZ01015166.1.p1  ORF type:complete len:648 (+),score=81.45 GFKZ01015166.1:626-2569(+)